MMVLSHAARLSALVQVISPGSKCRVQITLARFTHTMTPTLVPAPPMATTPLGAFATCHTTPSVLPTAELKHAENLSLDAR